MKHQLRRWVLGLLVVIAAIALIRQSNLYFNNVSNFAQSLEDELHLVEGDVSTTLLDRQFFLKILTSLEENKILSNDLIEELQVLAEKPYSVYLYKNDSLIYWSQPGLVIDPQYLQLNAFPIVMSDHKSDFLIKQYDLYDQKEKYKAFAKIPILNSDHHPFEVAITPISGQVNDDQDLQTNVIHSKEGQAICSIKLVGSTFSFSSQLALLVLGLLAFLFVCMILIETIETKSNVFGAVNTRLLQIAAVVGVRAATFALPFHEHFSEIGIAQRLFTDEPLIYSLLDFGLDGCILLWIVSMLSPVLSTSIGIEKDKKWIVQLNSIGNYLILILVTGLLSWMMRSVIILSNLNLDFENISFFNYQHFLCMLIFGIYTLASLTLIHEMIRQNIRLIPNLYSRLTHLVVAGLVSLPILGMINIGASLFAFFLAVFISSTLLDLYIEKGSKSVIWVITWLIAISGFSSILLYKYQIDNDVIRRSQTLETVAQKLQIEPNDIDNRMMEWLPSMSSKYSLGVFRENQLVFSYNHNYPIVLTRDVRPESSEITEIKNKNRSELVKRVNNLYIFAGKKIEGPIGVISLFSYIFTIYSILLFFVALINSFIRFLPDKVNISFSSKPSLRNRIQIAIVFIILLTFIIIGLVTVFYMRNSSAIDVEKRYEEKLQTISTSIQESTGSKAIFFNWRNAINQAAKIAYANNSRSKIYDPDGNLVFQRQNSFGQQGMPPVKMSFTSKMILDLSNRSFVLERSVGSDVVRRNGFIGVRSPSNRSLGYIEFPDVSVLSAQDDPGAHIFSTLLNAYVFLFLIAVALAIGISNSITRPLSELGAKMKKINLGKKNEPISWNNDDEIGELISDYNSMIGKLDESATILAQNERDMAWREMAKQVAHEIKNPLTPMKLSIQYLQNAIEQGKDNINELAPRVSQTLIEQIENLSRIASEFSNFATMPQSKNEKLLLNDVVASVHDLFRKRDDMDIQLYVPINEVLVFADKNQLIRVLNNVIKNAIQAIPNDRRGNIEIELQTKDEVAIIKVTDNGCGISEEMKEKVFYPNFTTKSSGTGLGLAMSSNILESFNGKIYFETELGEGSIFYIEIPLMKLKANFQDGEYVKL